MNSTLGYPVDQTRANSTFYSTQAQQSQQSYTGTLPKRHPQPTHSVNSTSHPSTNTNHSPLIMATGFENFCLPSTSYTPVHNITYSTAQINSNYRSTMTNRNVQLPPTLAYPHIYSQQFYPISNPYLYLPSPPPQ